MAPTLPFDEVGIVLATMTSGIQFLYFLIVVGLSTLGLYISDREIDKKKEKEAVETAKPYEYEWSELVPYALVSAVFTMSILEIFGVQFWQSLLFAVLMGMIFRTVLPELTKGFAEKIRSIMQSALGK